MTEELVSKLDSTGEVGKLKRYTLHCIVPYISFRIHQYTNYDIDIVVNGINKTPSSNERSKYTFTPEISMH